jgi:hypothetical protein
MKLLLESFYCPNDCDKNPYSKNKRERVKKTMEKTVEIVQSTSFSLNDFRDQIRIAANVFDQLGRVLTMTQQDTLYREAEECLRSLNRTQVQQLQEKLEDLARQRVELVADFQYEPGLGGWRFGDILKISGHVSPITPGITLSSAWMVDWLSGNCAYSSLSLNRLITFFSEQ